MDNRNYHWDQVNQGTTFAESSAEASKTFMTQVFGWMSGALVITALAAASFLFFPNLIDAFYKVEGDYLTRTALGWVVMFSPLVFVFLIGYGVQKLSFPLLVASFLTFSALMGLSLGYIFFLYDTEMIVTTFGITAGMFGIMAVMGWITKADLSSFGRIMMLGLIGIVIASIVNFFLQSPGLYYIISIVGVLVFTGLTAYDVQKLKNIGAQQTDSDIAARQSILGALTLYLDFINLFLFLLRLMGNRK